MPGDAFAGQSVDQDWGSSRDFPFCVRMYQRRSLRGCGYDAKQRRAVLCFFAVAIGTGYLVSTNPTVQSEEFVTSDAIRWEQRCLRSENDALSFKCRFTHKRSIPLQTKFTHVGSSIFFYGLPEATHAFHYFIVLTPCEA